MPLIVWLFLGYTISSVAGLIILKHAVGRVSFAAGSPWVLSDLGMLLAGAVLYVGGFALWLLVLARVELSVAYPIAVGLTLVFTTLASTLLFSEVVTTFRLVGIVLVFIGIVVITRSA